MYNTNPIASYKIQTKDKVVLEYNKLKKKVWFYLNGWLVADANLDLNFE